jgi:hypothetical protein
MTTSFGSLVNAELAKASVKNAEFVRIDIDGAADSPYFFSNSYRNEPITDPVSGTTATSVGSYTALGGLLGISGHQRDLSVTSYDTNITLVGVDQTKLGLIIDAGIKGSRIQIYRGFYDANSNMIDTPKLRYTGIVTSYTLTEDRVDQFDTFTLTINCSSYKTVLENRVSGRYTNSRSWKNYAATDTSMDRVAGLNNSKFDFGKKLA